MQQAQSHILNVDREIEQIVDRSEQHALARRDASMRQAETAVNVSVAGGIITLVVALSLTALIVHSINAPLRRLEHSMAAITRGELDATIPPPGRDEIGAMASTLGMLRDSLIERDRLERERRRAEAEIRAARDTAQAALRELKAAQANLIQAEKMASLVDDVEGDAWERKVLRDFFDGTQLKEIPASRKKRAVVLRRLAHEFRVDARYRETEVNELLLRHHPDPATLRRELVGAGLLQRHQSVYWRPGSEAEPPSA